MKLLRKLFTIYTGFFSQVEKYLESIYALIVRVYVFRDFFNSGYASFLDLINGRWDGVVYLYQFEFKTPLPAFTAAVSTFNELVFPVLLLLGLFGRFSALVLFAMAITIELTYVDNLQHYLWMAMCAYIVLRGSGVYSVDYFIHKKFNKHKPSRRTN